MKIDKVIFSTSEQFSVFWNLVAKVYKTKLNIHPVCLLLGDRRNTDMSEEHGTVIEVPVMPQWPHLIQITWSKFFWTTKEPDTTWLVGDIDLYPLCTHWFTSRIAGFPENEYVHLDADGICQLTGTKFNWANKEITAENTRDYGHDTNLPGHYHCAKGGVFKVALRQGDDWEEEIRHIVTSGRYNNTREFRIDDPIEQHNLWCAEEHRSTKSLRQSIIEGKVHFTGLHLRHGLDRRDGDRLDKGCYDDGSATYLCDMERLKTGRYVDLHCSRPFPHYLDAGACARRWYAIRHALFHAGMVDEAPVLPPTAN